MFSSLSSRIKALGAVVIAALAVLAICLDTASLQTRTSFAWVNHSADVIETIAETLIGISEAESGQRGFVLTHNDAFAQSFDARVVDARRTVAKVVALTSDQPLQNARAREIQRLMEQRIASLREPFELARQGHFAESKAIIATGHGRDLTNAIILRSSVFLQEERVLQRQRIEVANSRLTWLNTLALVGGGIISLLVILVSGLIVRGINRPMSLMMSTMSALGQGDRTARISGAMGSTEFSELAGRYNGMADQLQLAVTEQATSEDKLQYANGELQRNSEILRERGEVIELLGGMAHRMQAARTDEELAAIIRVFVPRVLPGIPGTLYAHNHSRNLLAPIAGWGGMQVEPEGFAPEQCWALRRGQSHFVSEPGSDILCGHVSDDAIYHCEPLLAGGEVIGVLYLMGVVGAESRFRLSVLTENIASALVNHRLQRGLREQTIRDPLTSLFNRRYMEEALAIEVARAARSGQPLSLVMCDVDHFKRFNDEFGHDAGDAVLQAVAAEMRSRFRDGDVVCRYGGEEFTIIAPGTTAEALAGRVEQVRHAISELNVRQNGRTLGTTSMSFGIATWNEAMSRDGSTLVQTADAALYRAKREGRNRAVIDLQAAA